MTTDITDARSTPDAATSRRQKVDVHVLARIDRLPSLSSVVAEFLQLCRKEFFTARDFEAVIAKDQALVARLLRVANSAMYGRPRSIRAIAEAVVLVGLESMTKMVYAVSTEGLTRKRLVNYAYDPSRGFWMHSTAVGLAARALAEALPSRPVHQEEAFVSGLLHDVGKLVIDDFLPPVPGKRMVTRHEEVSAVGLDHAELAEIILGQWRLPDSIVEAVRYHHCPDEAPANPNGARLLMLAQNIVATWQVGFHTPIDLAADFDAAPSALLIQALGLPSNKLPQILWDIRQQLASIEKMYPEA